MLDARPDEDDPVFDDRSRRASQRLSTDHGRDPSLRLSPHCRASLGSLFDGLWQERLHAVVPPLTSDNDAESEIHSRIRVPVQEPVDIVQGTGMQQDADATGQKIAVKGQSRRYSLGLEWDDPDPGRSAPTASITLTQEAASGDEAPGKALQAPPLERGDGTLPSEALPESCCTPPEAGPLSPVEAELEAVRLGIEWDDPDPGRSAPTASITLTQEAASSATNQLDADMDDLDADMDDLESTTIPTVPAFVWF
jgi:hypothetical protein